MNGTQLASALHRRYPGVPVILLTGFGEEMQALAELPDGVDLVIGKPVSAAELRRAIFTAMAVPRVAGLTVEDTMAPLEMAAVAR